jgi:cytochrome c-type biogenesis protein CcmF
MFLVPMLPLLLLLAPGMHAEWKRASFSRTGKLIAMLFLAALVIGIALMWSTYGLHSVLSSVGIVAGLWVAFSSLIEPVSRLRKGHSLSASVIGMCVAHFGLAMFVIGATTVESYKREADLSLRPGESLQHAGFDFKMTGLRDVAGPNYDAIEAEIVVSRDGREVTVLHPQKRTYRVQTNPMTEAGIDGRWNRDIFVAMGEPLGDGAWSLRLQYKPMIRFIWLGAFVIALGGFISVCDRRYRQRAVAEAPDAAAVAARARG